MYSDEIISEVWRNRDSYVKKHQNNLKQIIADLMSRQKKPHCKIIDRRIPNKAVARAKINPKPWNWEKSHEIG